MTAKPEVIPADPIRVLLRVCRQTGSYPAYFFGKPAQGKCSRSDILVPQPPFVDSRMPRP